MIKTDQFLNLPNELLFVFSSKDDGSMLDRTGQIPEEQILENRKLFCGRSGVSYDDTVFQQIVYGAGSTYDKVVAVDENKTTRHLPFVQADGLITKTPGVALFLPVADCIVTVLYDPVRRILAQLHMGRHSSLTNILNDTVNSFREKGSTIKDIKVWMAPSATKANYVLEYFDHANEPNWKSYVHKSDDGFYLDLQGHNQAILVDLGLLPTNIFISPIDTMRDPHYFSHAKGDTAGRFAGLAMMR